MQFEATSYRTKPVFSLLNKTFYGRALGLGYTHQNMAVVSISPPFCPDINPRDDFL